MLFPNMERNEARSTGHRHLCLLSGQTCPVASRRFGRFSPARLGSRDARLPHYPRLPRVDLGAENAYYGVPISASGSCRMHGSFSVPEKEAFYIWCKCRM